PHVDEMIAVADGAVQRFDLLFVGEDGGMYGLHRGDDVLSVHGMVSLVIRVSGGQASSGPVEQQAPARGKTQRDTGLGAGAKPRIRPRRPSTPPCSGIT